MVVDKLDIAALRLAERRGFFASAVELAGIGLTGAEYAARLRRLLSARVIRTFKATLVVPPLVGGDRWVWAVLVGQSRRAMGVANALASRLPFVTELVLNISLPDNVGPNLAVSFYSRDFESETQFIRSTVDLDYHEVYRVAEYSFPVALPLSGEERRLVQYVVANPLEDIAGIARGLGQSSAWVQAKIDRLLWSETNPSGVLRVLPEVSWAQVDNFGHYHFLIATAHPPSSIGQFVSEEGFDVVLGGRPFRGQHVQLEADVWGMGQLMEKVTFLNSIPGVRVVGLTWNQDVLVNDRWVGSLL